MPRPALVELVGAPGAGKSTVFGALREADDRIVTPPILTRRLYAPRFSGHVAVTLADFTRRGAVDRGWYPTLVAMAAALRALPPVLDRWPAADDVMVFDQGPLFTLTRPRLMQDRLRGWWDPTFDRWARLLDVVVWLDAPDEVLTERIEGRPKEHRLKGADADRAVGWLARDRELHRRMLERAESAPGGPRVLRFDTAAASPGEVAAETLAAVRAR